MKQYSKFLNTTLVLMTLALSYSAPALAQGQPMPQERVELMQRMGRLAREGERLIARGQVDDGLAKLIEAKRLEETIPGMPWGSVAATLGKALDDLGQPIEALAAFKDSLRYDARTGDLDTFGPYGIHTMDYAILLARQGRLQDAKAVYYYVLRHLSERGEAEFEPIPFLVVFDPDPTMTVRELTPEKLIAAATMVRAMWETAPKKTAERAHELEPTWLFPVMFLAKLTSDRRDERLALARNLARTDEEREWVRTFDLRATRNEIGRRRRVASPVLQRAKRDLATTHTRIASGRINPG